MIKIVVFFFCCLQIGFETDFCNFGLGLLIPRRTRTFLLSSIVLSLRLLYFDVICKVLFVFLTVLLQLAVFECYLASGAMQTILNLSKIKMSGAKTTNSSGNSPLFKKHCNEHLLNIHTCANILEIICNQAYRLFIPQALLLGGLMLIFAIYGTIRMHSVIPMPYYLGFPVLASIILLVVSSLLPPACKIHENSEEFLVIMKTLYSGSKYYIRKVKSLRSFRFNVYGMFCFQKSTQTTFCQVVFDFTINLLLMY